MYYIDIVENYRTYHIEGRTKKRAKQKVKQLIADILGEKVEDIKTIYVDGFEIIAQGQK